jgi:hypothetical protein
MTPSPPFIHDMMHHEPRSTATSGMQTDCVRTVSKAVVLKALNNTEMI